jgi:hypothetical protein
LLKNIDNVSVFRLTYRIGVPILTSSLEQIQQERQMNPAKKHEVPKREVPVALPLKPGFEDGSNAHIVTDAKNVAQGTFFGIKPGMTVAQARGCPLTAEQFKSLEYMLNAINHYEDLLTALQAIELTTPGRRVSLIVKEALHKASELKE